MGIVALRGYLARRPIGLAALIAGQCSLRQLVVRLNIVAHLLVVAALRYWLPMPASGLYQ